MLWRGVPIRNSRTHESGFVEEGTATFFFEYFPDFTYFLFDGGGARAARGASTKYPEQ
jgi:hypothetical protein